MKESESQVEQSELFSFICMYGKMVTGDTMTKLQKRLLIVISILTACMVFIAMNLFMAFNINPNQLKVRYQTIRNEKIPEDMGTISMVYLTDLQYGTFQDDQRMDKLIQTIQDLDPAILIFGGDLYDEAYTPTDESNQKLIDYFNEIEAPLGKFCVWGETDVNEQKNGAVQTVLNHSGFETLNNTSVHIGNMSHVGLRLVGLSTTPDYNVFSALSSEEYNLLITHYPDVLKDESLKRAPISLALAGNAHGTQLMYPLLGAYRQVEGAKTYNKTQMPSLSFDTILSSGVGCTKVDARLNADPEIHYFLFAHQN